MCLIRDGTSSLTLNLYGHFCNFLHILSIPIYLTFGFAITQTHTLHHIHCLFSHYEDISLTAYYTLNCEVHSLRLCYSFTVYAAVEEVKARMANVRHKLLVLSGKGGVGKSTFAAHLAHGLASDENKQVCAREKYLRTDLQ